MCLQNYKKQRDFETSFPNIIRNLKNSNYKFLFCYYRFIFCYYNFSHGYKMLIIIYLPSLNYFKK